MNVQLTPAALLALSKGDTDNFIAACTPGGIEDQEKKGQTMLVNSHVLPKKMMDGARQSLLEAGVQLGNDVDDIFLEAVLPPGWKKIATDHSMWSDLIDENGIKRFSIFYKAAFYDRNSFIRENK